MFISLTLFFTFFDNQFQVLHQISLSLSLSLSLKMGHQRHDPPWSDEKARDRSNHLRRGKPALVSLHKKILKTKESMWILNFVVLGSP